MGSSVEVVGRDSSSCDSLSLEEKRELIYALSKQPQVASEVLQSWSRQEIVQMLCAEMGKERKYSGLTKSKLVENLLNLVAAKDLGEHETAKDTETRSSTAPVLKNYKRKRKSENPSQVSVPSQDSIGNNDKNDGVNAVYCKNSACRATVRQEEMFCKRCSCCICYKYDDNKDPSLWLSCDSEPPFEGDSCGMSCHLECALKHEKSCIGKIGQQAELDGSFYCVICGKQNGLFGCWRKQLKIAKDTRRVDVLCFRVSLGQKLMKGTQKYQNLSELMDDAVKELEADVGPLTGSPLKMARGIVNRLSSGPRVQKLCSLALESLDNMVSDTVSRQGSESGLLRLEDIGRTSATVILGTEESPRGSILGFRLFCRKSKEETYPVEEICTVYVPNTRYTVTGLDPATEFCLKAVSFNANGELGSSEVRFFTFKDEDKTDVVERSQSPQTNSSSLINPSSVEDEFNNVAPYGAQYNHHENHSNNIAGCKDNEHRNRGEANSTLETNSEAVLKQDDEKILEGQVVDDMQVQMEGGLPITPSKSDTLKSSHGRTKRSISSTRTNETMSKEPENGSTSKETRGDMDNERYDANGVMYKDLERIVKVIRWLEQEGHIEKSFRERFLTWYSLRATHREVSAVKVFVETFMEDPTSLGEQLLDTFSECISIKRSTAVVPSGICLKLWH